MSEVGAGAALEAICPQPGGKYYSRRVNIESKLSASINALVCNQSMILDYTLLVSIYFHPPTPRSNPADATKNQIPNQHGQIESSDC